jgi:hypothetical protein
MVILIFLTYPAVGKKAVESGKNNFLAEASVASGAIFLLHEICM